MKVQTQLLLASFVSMNIGAMAHATQVFRIDNEGQLSEVLVQWSVQGTSVTTELPAGERYLLVVENVSQDQPGYIKDLFDARSDAWTHIQVNANQEGVILSSLDEFNGPQLEESGNEQPPGINSELASKGGSLAMVLEGSPELPFTISLHGTRERDRMDFNRDDVVDGGDIAIGLEAASMPQPEIKTNQHTSDPCCVVSEMSMSPSMLEAQQTNPKFRLITPHFDSTMPIPGIPACPIVVNDMLAGFEEYAGQ